MNLKTPGRIHFIGIAISSGWVRTQGCPEVRHSGQVEREPESVNWTITGVVCVKYREPSSKRFVLRMSFVARNVQLKVSANGRSHHPGVGVGPRSVPSPVPPQPKRGIKIQSPDSRIAEVTQVLGIFLTRCSDRWSPSVCARVRPKPGTASSVPSPF